MESNNLATMHRTSSFKSFKSKPHPGPRYFRVPTISEPAFGRIRKSIHRILPLLFFYFFFLRPPRARTGLWIARICLVRCSQVKSRSNKNGCARLSVVVFVDENDVLRRPCKTRSTAIAVAIAVELESNAGPVEGADAGASQSASAAAVEQ